MGLVKTRRLAAMQKQQRAKAAMKPPMKGGAGKGVPHIPRGRRPSREAVARGVLKCYAEFVHGVCPHGSPFIGSNR